MFQLSVRFSVCITGAIFLTQLTVAELRYVDGNQSTNGNGLGWQGSANTPYNNLQSALEDLDATEIWVAKINNGGSYKPNTVYPPGGSSRRATFYIPRGVKVFGGFLGQVSETSLVHRNPEVNETILDGNIDSSGTNDCFHVVYFDDANYVDTVLSGFTITNGRANGTSGDPDVNGPNDAVGGGIYITYEFAPDNVGPSLNRLRVVNNTAKDGGGGMFINNRGQVKAANLWFGNNSSGTSTTGGDGGALWMNNVALCNFQNCVFYENDAFRYGGAVAVTGTAGKLRLKNCTFNRNTATGDSSTIAGAIYVNASGETPRLELENSIVWGNDEPQIEWEGTFSDQLLVRNSDIGDGTW